MADDEQPGRLPYESALRVIGRHLDAEPAYHLSVLEVPEGFTVRSYPVHHKTPGRVVQFQWDKLRNLSVFHTAGRDISGRRQRHRGMWANVPSGHENFFRALGFVLDVEHAHSVSIDEVPEGVAVSYMRPTSVGAYEKCRRVHQRAEIEEMLRAAIKRRRSHRVTA